MYEQDIADMTAWLSHQNPKVSGNSTIVTPEDFGGLPLLHMSADPKIKVFTPSVTRRTSEKEDRTTARISTAPSLLGCISGYVALLYDLNDSIDGKAKSGWVVYSIPFRLALRPNRKLVDDVLWTDEVWLVGYNQNMFNYPATINAKFYIHESSIIGVSGSYQHRITLLVETGSMPLPFSPKVTLPAKGFYRIVLGNFNSHFNIHRYKDFKVESIGRAEYLALKGALPDLLSEAHNSNLSRW